MTCCTWGPAIQTPLAQSENRLENAIKVDFVSLVFETFGLKNGLKTKAETASKRPRNVYCDLPL
jgi:hypothetical protein